MTITITPRVRVGWTTAGAADMTSRTVGFTADLQLQLNRLATGRMTVTLRNNDGALTPGAGGTYASYDWFNLPLRLDYQISDGTTTAHYATFDGIITGFDLVDDGVESQVTLTATDLFSVGGRFKPSSFATFTSQLPTTLLTATASTTAFQGYWPSLAGTASVTFANYGNTYTRNVRSDTALSGITFNDLVNNVVLPGVRGWAWPRDVDSNLGVFHNAPVVAGTKSSTYRTAHSFATTPVAGSEIPYRTIKQGWTNDRTINTAVVKSLRTAAVTQVAVNAGAAQKYGSRAASYTQAAADTDTQAGLIATELVTRYANPRFQPLEIVTSSTIITANCTNSAYTSVCALFGMDWPLDLAEVTWRPAGAAADEYARCILLGRRLAYTFDKGTTITLALGSWSDNTEWIVGTSMLGYDRLG